MSRSRSAPWNAEAVADVDAAGGQVGAGGGVADRGGDGSVGEAGQQLFEDQPAECAGCGGDNDHGR
jgi:hypothetical protein